MSCTYDKELVQEFATGELASDQRRLVESHLVTCADCRMEVAGLRRLARDLTELPAPVFPDDLEEILVLASIQARRTAQPARPLRVGALRPSWIAAAGGLAGLAVIVVLVALLWPGRSMTPIDRVVGGGVGEGVGILDDVLHWIADFKTASNFVTSLFSHFSPLGKVARVVLGGIGGSIWAALLLGIAGATLLLWRVTAASQKRVRGVNHAKPQN